MSVLLVNQQGYNFLTTILEIEVDNIADILKTTFNTITQSAKLFNHGNISGIDITGHIEFSPFEVNEKYIHLNEVISRATSAWIDEIYIFNKGKWHYMNLIESDELRVL